MIKIINDIYRNPKTGKFENTKFQFYVDQENQIFLKFDPSEENAHLNLLRRINLIKFGIVDQEEN